MLRKIAEALVKINSWNELQISSLDSVNSVNNYLTTTQLKK